MRASSHGLNCAWGGNGRLRERQLRERRRMSCDDGGGSSSDGGLCLPSSISVVCIRMNPHLSRTVTGAGSVVLVARQKCIDVPFADAFEVVRAAIFEHDP
jgi:hypothetical protein